MSWDTTMTIMLRTLIGDFDATEFTDTRLQQIIVVAAQYVNDDIELDTDYTITIPTPNISPDPTTSTPPDDTFVNISVLKAACIIDVGSLRAAALTSGLEAKCGPAVMKTLKGTEGYTSLMENGYCKTYSQAIDQFNFGNAGWARGILSPFVNETVIGSIGFNVSPFDANYFREYRGRGA